MTRRATADLQEAMEYLGYELWMLAETSGRIPAAKRDADVVANNAYLESMLFHARSLADFCRRHVKTDPLTAVEN